MNHPERIFAAVNGASLSLPTRQRQLIGGWHQENDMPHAVEYVRADIHAAAQAEIKRLSGVVEELSNELDIAEEEGCFADDAIIAAEKRAEKAEAMLAEFVKEAERLKEELGAYLNA